MEVAFPRTGPQDAEIDARVLLGEFLEERGRHEGLPASGRRLEDHLLSLGRPKPDLDVVLQFVDGVTLVVLQCVGHGHSPLLMSSTISL